MEDSLFLSFIKRTHLIYFDGFETFFEFLFKFFKLLHDLIFLLHESSKLIHGQFFFLLLHSSI